MSEDPRCCGSTTCIIDAEGRCWCGQQWDGHRMCHSPLSAAGGATTAAFVAPDDGADAAQDGR